MREGVAVYSPRVLPSGGVRRLRVIADVFLFVAPELFNDDMLLQLRNSEYKLLTVNDLKTAIHRGLAGEYTDGFGHEDGVPQFTPDLINVMTGQLRDVLQEFACHVTKACSHHAG